MTATTATARHKRVDFELRNPHELILIEAAGNERSELMPIFEYVCEKCQHEFEALVFGSDKAECPKCHGKKLMPQLSLFSVSAKAGASQPASAGPCGSCGDPRGPGACSLGDLD